MKSLLRSFWEATIVSGESVFVSCRNEKYQQALLLVKFFYFFLFFVSTQSFSQFYQVPDWHQIQNAESMFRPIWSISWITYLPWKMAINAVLLFFITTSFAAVLGAVHYRWIRIATFIALLQYVSLNSSFGKVDHYLHAFIAVAFLLIFLPNHPTKSGRRQTHFLQLFWGCQLWLLTAYSSSGLFKFLGIGVQLLKGEIHALHPEALARNVAKGNLNFGNRMFFDTWLLDSTSWVFSAVQLAGYFIEVTSIFIIFYPRIITDCYYDWRSRSKQAYDEPTPRPSPTSGLPQQVLR